MKPENKETLRDRAKRAIADMYHNATLPYRGYEDMPAVIFKYLDIANEDAYRDVWIANTASYEIDYINNGGAYGCASRADYADILRSRAARKYTSLVAQAEYVRWGLRQMDQERAKYAMWERITEYGKVYQWGYGGRTLAPDGLARTMGGSSVGFKFEVVDDLSTTELTVLCQVVESFNDYVRATCAAFPQMWNDHVRDLMSEVADKIGRENEEEARRMEEARPDMYTH